MCHRVQLAWACGAWSVYFWQTDQHLFPTQLLLTTQSKKQSAYLNWRLFCHKGICNVLLIIIIKRQLLVILLPCRVSFACMMYHNLGAHKTSDLCL